MEKNRRWAGRLVMFCIGISIGAFVAMLCAGELGKAVGWLAAAVYAVGWRIEMWNADENKLDGAFWRRLWLNSRKCDQRGHADGMGPLEVVSSKGGSTGENVKDRGDV